MTLIALALTTCLAFLATGIRLVVITPTFPGLATEVYMWVHLVFAFAHAMRTARTLTMGLPLHSPSERSTFWLMYLALVWLGVDVVYSENTEWTDYVRVTWVVYTMVVPLGVARELAMKHIDPPDFDFIEL